MEIESFPDRTILVKDKEYLYFGGTSYLGMATNTEFQKLLFDNLKKWGMFYGSSRNSNIRLSIYERAEVFISNFIGAKSSITVSSGMLAGRLVMDHLSKITSTFFHYPKSHPAIFKSESLPLFVNEKLHPRLQDNIVEEVVISVDAVLALEVKPTSFDFLNEISSEKKVTLLIDESHSLGIVGEQGEGVFKTVVNQNLHRKIMISSLGKAIGLPIGVIASDKKFIDEIRNTSLFVSASGSSPAHLETFLEAQSLYHEQRQKLQFNLNILFEGSEFGTNYKFSKNYPVIYDNDRNSFDKLFEQGIIITSFKYPTYQSLMSRIVVTANHKEEDLKKLKYHL